MRRLNHISGADEDYRHMPCMREKTSFVFGSTTSRFLLAIGGVTMMLHNKIGLMAVLAAVALGLTGGGAATQDKKARESHAAHFQTCAKACADCMRECEACARYCAQMVAVGKKDHMESIGTCMDCAEFCAAASRIVSRPGPMSATICESCAKACEICATACEQFDYDNHMRRCAEQCRNCATACRDMLKHLKQGAAN